MTAHFEQSSFLYGGNATFIAELYTRYLNNPNSVDPSWSGFFADLDEDARAVLSELHGASWAPSDHGVIGQGRSNGTAPFAADYSTETPRTAAPPALFGAHLSGDQIRAAVLDSVRALMLIRIYRVRGHLEASLDPLGLEKREPHPELDPADRKSVV